MESVEPCPRDIETIILFTRYPVPGRVKTRLIPALGAEGAAQLQRRMSELTWKVVSSAARALRSRTEIRYEGGSTQDIRDWLGSEPMIREQGEGDLGTRLCTAFEESFREGSQRVVIVGADCPWLRESHINQALQDLRSNQLVIGPARDGGYYLIGLSTFIPPLFEGVDWGSGDVLKQTLDKAFGVGLTASLLEPLSDIDRPEDLSALPDFC